MQREQRRQFLLAVGCFFTCRSASAEAELKLVWRYQGVFGGLQVLADFVPGDLSRFENLARLRHDLRRALELRLPDIPVRLMLFHDRATMRAYLRRNLPMAPDRRALFVHNSQSSTILACEGPLLDEDLRHEFVHALLHNAIPAIPLWLDEGLAEYFEVKPAIRGRRQDYLGAIRAELSTGQPMSLSTLEQIQQAEQLQQSDYRHAWAWVHFMLHGCPPARDELVRFLADLGSGIPAGRLTRRLTQRVNRLERRFRDHFSNWT